MPPAPRNPVDRRGGPRQVANEFEAGRPRPRLSTRRNLITDVAGIRVGNAHDLGVASGVTAIVLDGANVASGVTRGGAPGTRDTTLLEPEMTFASIDAVLLSG